MTARTTGILCHGAPGCPYQARYRVHTIDEMALVIGPTAIMPRYCKRCADDVADQHEQDIAAKKGA